MRRLSPADELAEIRAEIQRLQARAEQIETALMRSADLRSRGTYHVAELAEDRVVVFDPGLLPAELREDPRFLREISRRRIEVIPIRARPVPLRPGWPIRRAGEGALSLH